MGIRNIPALADNLPVFIYIPAFGRFKKWKLFIINNIPALFLNFCAQLHACTLTFLTFLTFSERPTDNSSPIDEPTSGVGCQDHLILTRRPTWGWVAYTLRQPQYRHNKYLKPYDDS
jgi:hypothetical protein